MNINYELCPICNSTYKFWAEKNVDEINYQISKCTECNFAFVNPRPDIKWLSEWYSKSGHHTSLDTFKSISLDKIIENERNSPNSTIDSIRIFKNLSGFIKQSVNNNLLDVGSGYGFFTKEAINNKFNVTALELADEERTISKEFTGINPIPVSFEEFNIQDKNYYSVILLSQILEHASDINLWINKCHSLLNNDGIIVVALPNFNSIFRLLLKDKDPYVIPPAHLNYFNRNSLSSLLKKHGFDVLKVEYVTRIPISSIKNGKYIKLGTLSFIIFPILNLFCKILDSFGSGIMLNIYAKKIKL